MGDKALESYPASPNTVQLVCLDRVFGEFRWLRPVGVVEAFRGPFEDLAFDDAGV